MTLEAEQVRTEQPADNLPPPGELGEDLIAGKGDVGEVADAHVGPQFAHHPGHQLELVVVHPHGRAAGGLSHDDLRITPVHPHVRVPPLTVELGLGDHIVVQRP
jgi:hypothetical protein